MNQDELIQLAAAGAQALAELGAGESDELHEDPEAATTTGLDEALWLLSAAQRTGDDAGGYPRSNKRGRARTGDYPDLDRKRQRVSTDEEDEDEEERRDFSDNEHMAIHPSSELDPRGHEPAGSGAAGAQPHDDEDDADEDEENKEEEEDEDEEEDDDRSFQEAAEKGTVSDEAEDEDMEEEEEESPRRFIPRVLIGIQEEESADEGPFQRPPSAGRKSVGGGGAAAGDHDMDIDDEADGDSGLHPRMLRRASMGIGLLQDKGGADGDEDAKADEKEKSHSSDSESEEKEDDRESEEEAPEEDDDDDGEEDLEAEESQAADEETQISKSIEAQNLEREFTVFKEELYSRRFRLLEQELALIQDGVHPEYLQQLEDLEVRFQRRRKVWEAWKGMNRELILRKVDYAREVAECDFMESRRSARQESVGGIYAKMRKLDKEFESDFRHNLEEIEPVRSRVLDFQARRLLMRNQIEGRISKPWRPSTRSALAATLLPKRLGPRGTDPDVAQDMLVLASMSVQTAEATRKAAEAPRKFETKPLPEAGSQVNVTILDGPGAGGFSARVLSVTPSEIVLKRADGTKTRINVASLRSGRIIMT